MANSKSNIGVLNIWNHISIWCLNHDEPVQMDIMENTETFKTAFFACSANNETGHCANRLNLDDYQGIVQEFFAKMAEDPFSNLTNYTFSYKGARQKIFIKVLEYTDDSIRLGIKNRTILG